SRRCRLGHVISCVPITADHIALKIRCSPRSATCQCPSVPPVSAHQCHLSVLIIAMCQCHINDTYQCIPVHINATYQCPSELPFNVTHQCQSVPPNSASQCRLSVPYISAMYPCCLSVPISDAC
ncbi:unnamed protein product, partial [Staurois parvus]